VASFKKTLNSIIIAAEKQVVKEYTKNLRSHASSYGWPEEVTSNLMVSHDGNSHSISYPKSIENAVLTLEYGTQHVPPSPALRTFMLGAR
jgi:hypothetical protein